MENDCYICPVGPLVRWWDELEVEGQRLRHMVAIGPEDRAEWFMLEFPEGTTPLNPPAARMRFRRIEVREKWFAARHEQVHDYIRRKALEWLEAGCETEQGLELRDALREWRKHRKKPATKWEASVLADTRQFFLDFVR